MSRDELLKLAEEAEAELVSAAKAAIKQSIGPGRTAHRTAAAEWAAIARALRACAALEGGPGHE